ncbi:hypothetical protein [uncultured Jatrophihabitans sp.]|uniref:hypothetical protein n=1 Tax=uncultured Jatrophihabitans sp. TaxID=1610747 RepID=UPI0035CB84C5
MTPGQAIRRVQDQLHDGETVRRWGEASLGDRQAGRRDRNPLRGAAAVTEDRLIFSGGDEPDAVLVSIKRPDIESVHSYWERSPAYSIVTVTGDGEYVFFGLSTSVRGALESAIG